jgi:hypothetical protein
VRHIPCGVLNHFYRICFGYLCVESHNKVATIIFYFARAVHCKKSHGQIPLHSQDVHGPKSSWHGKCLLLLAWVKPCSILQFFNSNGKFQLENPSTDKNFPLMTLPEAGVFHCEWGFLIIFFPPTGSFRLFTLSQTVIFQ